jgi:hypothetical protein
MVLVDPQQKPLSVLLIHFCHFPRFFSFQLLRQRGPNAPQEGLEELPELAQRLEESLYRSAKSFQEYSDASTLKQRIQQLAVSIGMKTKMMAQKQHQHGQPGELRQQQQHIQPRRQQQQQMNALSTSSCAILRSNCLQAPVQQVSSSTTTGSKWRISTRLWATNSLSKCKLNSQLQHRNRLN